MGNRDVKKFGTPLGFAIAIVCIGAGAIFTSGEGIGKYYILGLITTIYLAAVAPFINSVSSETNGIYLNAPRQFNIFGFQLETFHFRPKLRKLPYIELSVVFLTPLFGLLSLVLTLFNLEGSEYWRLQKVLNFCVLLMGALGSLYGPLLKRSRFVNIYFLNVGIVIFVLANFFEKIVEPIHLFRAIEVWTFSLCAAGIVVFLLYRKNTQKWIKSYLVSFLFAGPFVLYFSLFDLNVFFDPSVPVEHLGKVESVFRGRGAVIEVLLENHRRVAIGAGQVAGAIPQANDILSYKTSDGFFGLEYYTDFQTARTRSNVPDSDADLFFWMFGGLAIFVFLALINKQCEFCDAWIGRFRLKCPKCGCLKKISHPVSRKIGLPRSIGRRF